LTEPDADVIDKRAGQILKELIDLVYPVGYNPEATASKQVPPSGASAAKRVKSGCDISTVDVATHAQNGTLSTLTVPVLKEFLKSVGKKGTGKKEELVAAVKEHYGIPK
jgi:ATP-dependent DNA helicase 2 subunit 1